MDRMLQMILRRVVMRLVNRGVDAGLDQMSRRTSVAPDRDIAPPPRPGPESGRRSSRF